MSGFWEVLIMWIIGLLIAALFIFLGWGLWQNYHSPTLELRKDQWACTRSHSDLVSTYNPSLKTTQVMVIDVCDEYRREK